MCGPDRHKCLVEVCGPIRTRSLVEVYGPVRTRSLVMQVTSKLEIDWTSPDDSQLPTGVTVQFELRSSRISLLCSIATASIESSARNWNFSESETRYVVSTGEPRE